MAIIIIAPELDEHADWIEWGLKQSGLQVIRWGLGWEQEYSASITFGMRDGIYLAGHRIEPEDTVWIRRPWPSIAPHPSLAPDEVKFASSEYQAFRKTLLMNIELTGAFCINKWSAANSIENKSVQLALATKCGLSVPTTVMTNASPFVRELQETVTGDVVHKSYLTHTWVHEGSDVSYACETTRLERHDKLPDEVFAYAPGIYQQKIEKEYDVRITMVGEEFHAFVITTRKKELDWRFSNLLGKVSMERMALPAQVQAGLRRFADRAGIVFGCFDMAVDGKENWWFLEVNQAGQFLGVDWLHPDDGLYRPMLKFLSSREPFSDLTFPTFHQCLAQCQEKDYGVRVSNALPYLTVAQERT
jgi:glutathione synthase/RimK-type ligase-like ATP-grasp enzyme